jgi:transposase
LAGDALNQCRRRIQQAIYGHRGRKDDPLYRVRRTLHTGADLLTDKQQQRLDTLFADDAHIQIQATWGIYQRMITAYREPNRARGRQLMVKLIDSVSRGVPAALTEIITLGRTLTKRAGDVLAHFDRPGTSNGPTEAINGRLEHLRDSALGFRNLTNYIARSLLEVGGSNTDYTLDHEEPEIASGSLFPALNNTAHSFHRIDQTVFGFSRHWLDIGLPIGRLHVKR